MNDMNTFQRSDGTIDIPYLLYCLLDDADLEYLSIPDKTIQVSTFLTNLKLNPVRFQTGDVKYTDRQYYYVYSGLELVYLCWREWDAFGFTDGGETFLSKDRSWIRLLLER